MHLAIREWVLLCILLGWWLISLLYQFRSPTVAAIRAHDIFHFIPNWRLFAPVPTRRDYRLEYRLMTSDGTASGWSRIVLVSERRTWWIVWHPQKRVRKASNTAIKRIVRKTKSGSLSTSNCLSHGQILRLLQNSPLSAGAQRIQFRILTSQDYAQDQSLRLVFTSSWHPRR